MPTPKIIPASSLEAGTRVVLYGRVSEYAQVSKGSLHHQRSDLVMWSRELGLTRRGIASGCEYGKLSWDRPAFLRAVDLALRHDAGILATNATRFLRAEAFDKETNPWAEPTEQEWEALLALAKGGRFLATLIDPSTPLRDVHAETTRRRMEALGKKGGRPSKIGPRLGRRILEDHARGESIRAIAKRHKRHKLSKSAVQRFLAEMGMMLGEDDEGE